MELLGAKWALNEMPWQLEITHRKKYTLEQLTRNLDGIPMNI